MLKRTLVLIGITVGLIYVPLVGWGDTSPLIWNTPYGNFNLNLTTTEMLTGYDAVLKQAIAGVSLPIYTDPKGLVTLHVGGDTPWQTNGATFEPLIMAGHDVLKDLPPSYGLASAGLNIFGRWSTEQGKAGVGIAFSYAFGGSPLTPPAPAPTVQPVP